MCLLDRCYFKFEERFTMPKLLYSCIVYTTNNKKVVGYYGISSNFAKWR